MNTRPRHPVMLVNFQSAQLSDLLVLRRLMGAFNAEGGYPADPARTEPLLIEFLANPDLGRAWIIQSGGQPVGYLVICHCFSFEHGGRDAFIDEIYLIPTFRRRGLASAALAFVQAHCAVYGIRALHLEVEQDNQAARALYRKNGFTDPRRPLMMWKPARSAPPEN